jgi:ligand-binding sensor domain-containing protein
MMQRFSVGLLALSIFPGALGAQVLTSFTSENGLLDNNVHSVCNGLDGDLWLGTQSGVAHFDGTAFLAPITVADGLIHETVFAVLCDSNGEIWMGTDFGLSRFDGASCVTYTTDDGLEDNRIKHLFEDASGGIWVAHNDGVSSFDGADFVNYTTANGLPFGGVNHIAQDALGHMWFGTGLGGAFQLIGDAMTGYTSAQGLPNNSVRSIAVDEDGRKWIGTNEGIAVFGDDNTTEETHLSLITLPPPHVINPVEDVVIDLTGRTWVGVYVDYLVSVGGVAYFNGLEWVDFDVEDGLAGPNVRQLTVAENGDVWVATSTGVTRFSGTPVGMAQHSTGGFGVHPNPSSDWFKLECPTSVSRSELAFVLRDAMGRIVAVPQTLMNHSVWDVSSLRQGLYFLHIQGEGVNHTERIWVDAGLR